MAFPWVFQENFDAGSRGNFDAETDTNSKLSFPHYTVALANPPHQIPYRGAYSMFIDLSGGTADAFVSETGDFDQASEVTRHLRFYFWVSNLTMAASDRFDIFELLSATSTVEAAIGIVNTAGTIQIGASETASSTQQLVNLVQNAWHSLELTILIDQDADADGTIDFFVDGIQVGSQITSLTHATITSARFGSIGIDAGTTSGYLLFNEIVYDDGRVYPFRDRFAENTMLTDNGHAALGPGRLAYVTLDPGAAADCELLIYDTDEANTNDESNLIVPPIRNASASIPVTHEVNRGRGYFRRGCYVSMTGTNPRATFEFDNALISQALIANYAKRRSAHGVS